MTDLTYTVKFRPGRFRYMRATALQMAQPTWIVGREDDGQIVCFVFAENEAKQICLAMNLTDAYLRGDTTMQKEILKTFDKIKDS